MGTLKLQKITPATVRGGDFIDSVPELYELSSVVENNEGHDHDDVFNHTVHVLGELVELIKDYEGRLGQLLGQRVVKYTRKDLLMLATMLHDIAKKETLVKNADGRTSAEGHEKAGMRKAQVILQRFDLSAPEAEIVLEIIGFHGELHLLSEKGSALTKSDTDDFRRKHAKLLPELLLLCMADTKGSQLEKTNLVAFDKKMNFFRGLF
jgi:UTP:GlnB (protein PII) uridylyltransferase